jgi:multidrug efflux pump subunit AcrA (membrane-fusion protein)
MMSDFDELVQSARARYDEHEAALRDASAEEEARRKQAASERQQRLAKASQLIELAGRIAEALAEEDHEHDLVSEEIVEKRSLFRTRYEPIEEHTFGWALVGPRRVMVPSDHGQLYYADGVLLTEDGTILVFGQGHIGRDAFNTGVPTRAPVPEVIKLMEDDGVTSWTFALDTPDALADAHENTQFRQLTRSTSQYGPIPVTVDAIEAGMAALVARCRLDPQSLH